MYHSLDFYQAAYNLHDVCEIFKEPVSLTPRGDNTFQLFLTLIMTVATIFDYTFTF